MKVSARLAICAAGMAATSAISYEVDTHEYLSRNATFQSVLAADPEALKSLGIYLGLEQPAFPLDRNAPNDSAISILDLIAQGSRLEDDRAPTIRVLRHFYDPVNGRGLTVGPVSMVPSPSWALGDIVQDPNQVFSYRDARQTLFNALTLAGKKDRDIEFGQTFRALGHIIHHLQDMAQPQHVRNDAHCGFYCAWTHPSSFYEDYSNRNPSNLPVISQRLPFRPAVYSPDATAPIDAPRKFWGGYVSGVYAGQGIADFTNRNFVSAGTNFDQSPPRYSRPVSTGLAESGRLEDICPQCGTTGRMDFYGSNVDDLVMGGDPVLNGRAASYSVFTQGLLRLNLRPVYTLNQFNFDVAHDFLIPRAISYSSGMLNYFFRGKIDLEFDEVAGSFVIRNLGPESLNGKFSLYYDVRNGDSPDNDQRRLVPQGQEWDNVAIASGGAAQVSLALPGASDPQPRTPGRYILVFVGDMGNESRGPQSFGAVTGKVVDLTSFTLFTGASGNIGGSGMAAFNFIVSPAYQQRITLRPLDLKLALNGQDFPATSVERRSKCSTSQYPATCTRVRGMMGTTGAWEMIVYDSNLFTIMNAGLNSPMHATPDFIELLNSNGQFWHVCKYMSSEEASGLTITNWPILPLGSSAISLLQRDPASGGFATIFSFNARDLGGVATDAIEDVLDVAISSAKNIRVNTSRDIRLAPVSVQPNRQLTCGLLAE